MYSPHTLPEHLDAAINASSLIGCLNVVAIQQSDELLACEYLRDLGADIDGDSESDGPDTIRVNGQGWVLVLAVQ